MDRYELLASRRSCQARNVRCNFVKGQEVQSILDTWRQCSHTGCVTNERTYTENRSNFRWGSWWLHAFVWKHLRLRYKLSHLGWHLRSDLSRTEINWAVLKYNFLSKLVPVWHILFYPNFSVLTHVFLGKLTTISQTIFSGVFLWIKKFCMLIKITLNFVP